MQKPLIIVAGHLETHSASSPILGQKEAYIKAVIRAGGLPFIVAPGFPLGDLDQLLALGDGFLLCGGGDVEPGRYGGESCPRLGGVDLPRDEFEIELIHRLLKADKPLMAICRGVQVLNVALGGTLICDIGTQLPQAGKHDYYPDYPRHMVAHEVSIQPQTLLAKTLGVTQIGTNSLHHQALDVLGEGLVVNAHTSDDIIEGVEMPSKSFVLGLQWHPECMPDSPQMQRLFTAFIQASTRPA